LNIRKIRLFSFDIFAASFYLIVRYEEYLGFKKDKYGRFGAEKSLAYKEGFLEDPLINIWSNMFYECLCKLFPGLNPIKTGLNYLSTIDIDNAWAHLNKGFTRTSLSFAKLMIKGNIKGIVEKIKVLTKKKKDPYDNFDFLNNIHNKYGIQPIYFILFSKFARNDKNPSRKNLKFRKLVQDISENNLVGLHPSYQSNNRYQIIETEKKMLEDLTQKTLYFSRQHYLFLKMPETYENLIKAGLSRDFSMGYSSHVGFRASYCRPYNFFNLKTNEERPLEIVPFETMDVCFSRHQKIKPEIALNKIKKIISSIKKVNGLYVSIWHNETLANIDKTMDWRAVYEEILNETTNGNPIY